MAREKFCFWLNLEKEDEYILADHIFELKQERSFVSTIRDGIRLIRDLRAGRLEVLFELFPWVQNELEARSSGSDQATKERIARLEQMLLQQNSGLKMHHNGGPKPLSIPRVTAPVFQDDDTNLVAVKQAASAKSAQNFLQSAFTLNQ